MNIIISNHALFEMIRRQLTEEMVRNAVNNPHQVLNLIKERKAFQYRYNDPIEDKEMLLRVICEEHNNTIFVITAYRTTKIDKYWAKER
jgi:hypothetical protein